jgi:hypothetical protein
MSDNNQNNQNYSSSYEQNQNSNNTSDNNSFLLSILQTPGVPPQTVYVNVPNYSTGDTSGYSTQDENNNNNNVNNSK